jgi:gliding motility-associated-like protein
VIVQDNCGTGTDAVVISENNCSVYFPTGFTPNNDGRNDLFKVLSLYQLADFRLSVYNRWGMLVFETKDPARGWDGRVRGQMTDTGLFAWYCEFKKPGDSQPTSMKGVVMLAR